MGVLSTARADSFDENVVCPVDNKPLRRSGDRLISVEGRQYRIVDDIALLFAEEALDSDAVLRGGGRNNVTREVKAFYEDAPFPDYNTFDNLASFVRSADAGVFARLLREQMPLNANVLEIGCGTGQLSNYLAATTLTRVYATDMAFASLRLGRNFARQNGIEGVRFVQMNLFVPAIQAQSMDIVIANGVLHHTYDTAKAFASIARLVKPSGYVIIGLYDRIGRLGTDFRRVLTRIFGDVVLARDPYLRKKLSPGKRRAWIRDQYLHPCERKHSMSEVIGWFEAGGFSFISSIPRIVGSFDASVRLFERQDTGSAFDRLSTEFGMLMSSYGALGGLFICIGQKRGRV
jgi:SAM-dependent methyltransferase